MKLKSITTKNRWIIAISFVALLIVGTFVFRNSIVQVLGIGDRRIPIYCVDTEGENNIAISFDASWGADNTIKLLDILDEEEVKSTFFLVGRWVDEYEKEVKEIHNRGHELGNHSNSHPNMTTLSKDKIIKEIIMTDSKIRNLTGEKTKVFRCPEGAYDNKVIEAVEETGHATVQWDVDSIDWKEQGAEIEYERVIKNVKAGSIILFHNNAKFTPENLPRVIKALKEKGFKFVKISDLLIKEDFSIDHTGKQYKN